MSLFITLDITPFRFLAYLYLWLNLEFLFICIYTNVIASSGFSGILEDGLTSTGCANWIPFVIGNKARQASNARFTIKSETGDSALISPTLTG